MKEIILQSATQRVRSLREYYIHHSPTSLNRELGCGKCHRSLLLYVQGWEKSISAPTARIRRSMAEAYMLSHTKPIIIENELLVGQPNFDPFDTNEEKEYFQALELEKIMPKTRGRKDHLALDYQLLLDRGIEGILSLLNEKLAAIDPYDGRQIEQYEFYFCCKIELEGLLCMCENYAAYAKDLAESCANQEKREEYFELYQVLKQVPAHPARSFREALQSIHMFTWSLYGLYSFGKPDVYLLPYYRRDIERGVLTRTAAQELIDCFFLQSVPNMSSWAAESLMLGGRDNEGKLVENELTWHFLTAIAHTHLPDPNVGFCVTEETGDEVLHYAASLIADGHGQPQIWNSDEITRSMLRYGFDKHAAYMFTSSTCAEITPIGCSGISITSPYINLLQIFLDSFARCDNNSDFEDIFETFRAEFRSVCNEVIRQQNLFQLERGRNGTDPMRISLLIHDCLERGCSNDRGGARYNHLEPNILGMQNVTESLNVLQRLVFEEKYISIEELQKALQNDYEQYEELLWRIRHKTVHFGTGDATSNKIAKRVADMILETFAPMTTVRGAKIIPGAFSYREHELQGKKTKASLDGRKSGMPLNDGSCPVQGYDNLGPTLSLMSTVSWEPARFLGGTAINVKLNKGIPQEKLVALIKGYLKIHGTQLQFNVVDAKMLHEAQKNPEKYSDLLVRIGGYSDFFVRLPKELQDEILSRTQNEI